MSNLRRFFAYLIPGAVFQSVIVGGAYGTGREVAEFISRFGALGGLYVITTAALGFGVVLAVSFEFARITRCFDYRSFLRALLGRSWVLYEGLFLLLLVIVLAVTGAAAGKVLFDAFAIPQPLGTAMMLFAVTVFAYCGRRLVEMSLTIGAGLLTAIIAGVAWCALRDGGTDLAQAFVAPPVDPEWTTSAAKFVLYNSALVPVLLYVAAPMRSRHEALSAGFIAGVAGVLPALLFHLAFMTDYPAIINLEIPTYHLIENLRVPYLLEIFVCMLFVTIVQTGVGVLHGVNERLDTWMRARTGRPLAAYQHAVIAGVAVGLSLVLAKFGIVALVAQGYGTLAWGFLAVYTLPVLTLGVWRIYRYNA